MNTNTQPAWATLAAVEICGRYTDKDYGIYDMGATIASHAPDAEALAVALESCKEWIDKLYAIRGKWEAPGMEARYREVSAAIAAYRARFPKA